MTEIPGMMQKVLFWKGVTNIYGFSIVATAVCCVALAIFFYLLHRKVEANQKRLLAEFPDRADTKHKRICLIAIRLALIWFAVKFVITVVMIFIPVPPFIGFEFMEYSRWRMWNHDLIAYYRSMAIASALTDILGFLVSGSFGVFFKHTLDASARRRSGDMRDRECPKS